MKNIILFFFSILLLNLSAQNVSIDLNTKYQVIDGFGAHQGNAVTAESWWQDLYYDDLGASIYRVDLTPQLKSPYNDLNVYSPWFMGSSVKSPFNLEDPANPDGPEGNRVRTYTGPNDYSRLFGGQKAPIAIMGPDIEMNIKKFQFPDDLAITKGVEMKNQLGDFKLIGSLWSPVPWVKVSSGNIYPQNWWPGPVVGSSWPFIWGGNFAGGRLDVSGTPLAVFDDSGVGGTGPTSSLTQFIRSTAAYVLGYQRKFNTTFYALSIQNELNFEQFYHSATYPLSSQYITALNALKAEFAKYPELAGIKFMGPEDLLGGDAYGMWEYGSGTGPIHKNLQYLKNIQENPTAAANLDFFCIHGYAADGITSAGSAPLLWDWWAQGWQNSPAPGIPANVKGFTSYNKKSWMTETSGENPAWLYPASGFPNQGGWSIALKLHQALTTGMESAWLYWTFTGEDNNGNVGDFALTNHSLGALSPKYIGAKHFFKYIRPGAYRIKTEQTGTAIIYASAFLHELTKNCTAVLINGSNQVQTVQFSLNGLNPSAMNKTYQVYKSSLNDYWKEDSVTLMNGTGFVIIPSYGVATIVGDISGSTSTLHDYDVTDIQLQCANQLSKDQLQVNIFTKQILEGELMMHSSNGQKIIQDKVILQQGKNAFTFPIHALSAGLYTITLHTSIGTKTISWIKN